MTAVTLTLRLPPAVADALAELAAMCGEDAEALASAWVARAAERECGSVGRTCYELRRSGLMWSEIAERMGHAGAASSCQQATHYARTHGLPWPIGVDGRRRR